MSENHLEHYSVQGQKVEGNAVAINAGIYNNNIFDDPFHYYADKKLKECPELRNKIKLVELFINKENLKRRFNGMHTRYIELIDCLTDEKREEKEERVYLDDGYKSVISAIVNITKCFAYPADGGDAFLVLENPHLSAKIISEELVIFYSDDIRTYEEYLIVDANAQDLVEKNLKRYLSCATTYGNFFQFGRIRINQIENAPFISDRIKFSVSNKIIPNLIEPLYGDSPECGLREIIQNACDAMKELKEHDINKEYIELHIEHSKDKTILKVRDYGIGMTEEVLLKKYFIVGESSKKGSNLNLVGQFGIGALAAFLLGDQITVKTKSCETNLLYSFEYSKSSDEGDHPIAVSIIEDETFEHGTEVSVILKEELHLECNKLENKLKINEWYIMPDCEIKYFYNHEQREIASFTGEEYKWVKVSHKHENEFQIKYLDRKNNNFHQIIYNGLMVPQVYDMECKNLVMMPYISVSSSSDLITLNLARSKVDKGLDLIVNPVKNLLIRKGLEILKEKSHKILSEDGTILLTKYSNDYIRNIPLFFTRNGFGIMNFRQQKANKFIFVYGYDGNRKININDLTDGVKYIFIEDMLDKTQLSDCIRKEECIADSKLIKSLFYDAVSYHYGFDTGTMKYLYEHIFSKSYDKNLSASQFWDEHNKIKDEAFKSYFDDKQDLVMGKIDEHIALMKDIKEKTDASFICFEYIYSNSVVDDCFDVGIIR